MNETSRSRAPASSRAERTAPQARGRFARRSNGRNALTTISRRLTSMFSRPTGAILMYHRIEDVPYDPWRLAVRPSHFEQHLQVLARRRVVPLSKLLSTPGAIAVTFDDGYADFVENALPLLEKYEIPATLFYPTDALDGREFWWDRVEHALLNGNVHAPQQEGRRGAPPVPRWRTAKLGARLRALHPAELAQALDELDAPKPEQQACARHRMLTRDQLRTLARSPLIEIGAHTCSHPCLPQLSEDEQVREISESRQILEEIIRKPVKTFSYPYGAHDDGSVRAAERSGIDIGCIVGGGLLRADTHPLRLPRLMVRDWNRAGFTLQLELWKALRWLS